MRALPQLISLICTVLMSTLTFGQILDDFESVNAWTAGVNGEWTASTTTPIEGTKSLKHNGTGTTSGSTNFSNVSRAIPAATSNLSGATTTWEFKLKTSGKGVSASQKFWIVLAANGTNMRMPNTSNVVDISVPSLNGINGYAIGVNPVSSTASARPLKLMRITNSAASDLVTVPGPSYGGNYGNSTAGYNTIGIKVIRNASAAWTVYADFNNDGTYEVITNPVTDNTHTNCSFVGASLRWPTNATASSTLAGNMYLDNFSFNQVAAAATYYSINNGNLNGANTWSLTNGGSPTTPIFNSSSSLVISHNITIDGSFALANVTLNAGGTLTAGSTAQTLTLTGNWTNNNNSASFNGNFDPTCCTAGCRVIMGGTNAQTIGGSSGTRFMELQINNAAGVTLNAPVFVTAAVIPTAGTLTTNGTGGSLALLSNASCSGSIQSIGANSDVVGPITLQRYIPSESRASWLFLSCPLYSNAALTTGLSPNAAWSSATVNGITYPTITMTSNSIKWYNETLVGGSNVGFTVINPSTGVINPQLGLNVYANSPALTVNPSGFFMKGTVNIPMTYTPSGEIESFGRNLLANPYPSEVNWDIVEAASSDIGAYYVFDYATNNYLFYNPNNGAFNSTTSYPDGIGKFIPHSQSFFVHASTTNQSLTFTENAKVNRCNPKLFERSSYAPAVDLQLLDNQLSLRDVSTISNDLSSSPNFDAGMDVIDLYDLTNNKFNLSLLSEEKIMLMSTSVSLENENVIPVYLDLSNDQETFEYAYIKINHLDGDHQWTLLNYLVSQPMYIIREQEHILVNPGYHQKIENGDLVRIPFNGSFHGTAFLLQNCTNGQCPDPEILKDEIPFSLNVQHHPHSVIISAGGNTMQRIQIFNNAGQSVLNTVINNVICEIPTATLPAGIYTVRVNHSENKTDITRFVVR